MPEPTAILTTPVGLTPQSSQQNGYTTSSASPPALPSFYSPRPTAATPRAIPDFDLSQHSSATQSPAAVPPYLLHQAQSPSDGPQPLEGSRSSTPGPAHHLVPPSLLSPAFTPPATPGTGTPALQREPTGVPVDSRDAVNGGAGAWKPKLLERLPEVRCTVRARIPTTTGTEMFLHLYHNDIDNKEHLAIVFGSHIRSRSLDAPRPGETEMDRMIRGAYTGRLYPGRTTSQLPTTTPSPSPPRSSPLIRIHSECYTGETAWSARCDCGEQLDEAARLISLPPNPNGCIIYLRQEGRGIGLLEKLKAYNLQDLGSDTVEANLLLRHPADARSYGLATAILVDLGLGGEKGVRLLTNNPEKVRAVEGPEREVVVKERVAMVPVAWRTGGKSGVRGPELGGYLKAKIEKMGHLLRMDDDGEAGNR
ncbi:MAG: GTP cyclohydrolase II [Geoglossum simile]|nr:MAG: GTP cyclohydrolase II [Geoglossum simile]